MRKNVGQSKQEVPIIFVAESLQNPSHKLCCDCCFILGLQDRTSPAFSHKLGWAELHGMLKLQQQASGWEGLWFYGNMAGVLVPTRCLSSLLERWSWARSLAEGSSLEVWWCLESDGGSSGVPAPLSVRNEDSASSWGSSSCLQALERDGRVLLVMSLEWKERWPWTPKCFPESILPGCGICMCR